MPSSGLTKFHTIGKFCLERELLVPQNASFGHALYHLGNLAAHSPHREASNKARPMQALEPATCSDLLECMPKRLPGALGDGHEQVIAQPVVARNAGQQDQEDFLLALRKRVKREVTTQLAARTRGERSPLCLSSHENSASRS